MGQGNILPLPFVSKRNEDEVERIDTTKTGHIGRFVFVLYIYIYILTQRDHLHGVRY